MVEYFTIRIHVYTYIAKYYISKLYTRLVYIRCPHLVLETISQIQPHQTQNSNNFVQSSKKKLNLQFSQHPSITSLDVYHTHGVQSTYIVQYTTQPHSRLSIRQPKPINQPFIQLLLSIIYYYLYIDTNFNIFSTTSITLQFI